MSAFVKAVAHALQEQSILNAGIWSKKIVEIDYKEIETIFFKFKLLKMAKFYTEIMLI